ncbi:hypothetical protein BRC70_01890 [Halobacteriales archaeon QH_6_68_27]|nr:MAG: hypothetical protein BRC70_01890 [Halobacteriales archaeon QH_6_68_27]
MSLAHRARENLLATAGLFLFSSVVGLVSGVGLLARGVFAVLGWGGPVGGTLAALVPAFVVGLFVAVPVTWLSVLGLSYGVLARLVRTCSPTPRGSPRGLHSGWAASSETSNATTASGTSRPSRPSPTSSTRARTRTAPTTGSSA